MTGVGSNKPVDSRDADAIVLDEPQSLRDAWRRSATGDPEALQELLRAALSADPVSAEGRAARRTLGRAYRRRARALVRQAERTAGDAAAALLDEANESFFMALVAAHAPALEEALALAESGASPEKAETTRALATETIAPTAPGPPLFVTPIATTVSKVDDLLSTKLLVEWTPPAGAGTITGYDIKAIKVPANDSAPVVGTVSGTATSYTFAGLNKDTTYTFTVTAKNTAGTGPASAPSQPATVGKLAAAFPIAVTATSSDGSVQVEWKAGNVAGLASVTGYLVTTYFVENVTQGGAQNTRAFLQIPTKETTATIPVTTNGTYEFGVRALSEGGYSQETRSRKVNIDATNLRVQLPSMSADPAVTFDSLAPLDVGRRLSEAAAIGRKWRYEHLRDKASKAAERALAYDRMIVELMSMTVEKAGFAEVMLSPVLDKLVTELNKDQQRLSDYSTSGAVRALAGDIGSLTSQLLLLQAILRFLIETNPIAFWVGLFESLIKDLASISVDFDETKAYLDRQFKGTDVGTAVQKAAATLARESGPRVEELIAPLRVAVDRVVGGTSTAMQKVFESFDLPLLMAASPDRAGAPVPNVNPLDELLEGLEEAVAGLEDSVKRTISDALTKAGQGTPDLFRSLVITYIVLPILAFVLVGMAGGPATAAALAAVILVAAEQLVHLITQWLSGPLDAEVARLESQIADKFGELRAALAQQVGEITDPQDNLNLLASELLQLKELLPEAFLDDAAAVLAKARDSVLRDATGLAVAAERALGIENATAFDVVSLDHRPHVSPAPQLPGGTAPSLFGGASVLADLEKLERGRVQLRDPKEMDVTYRLSLARLLGQVDDLEEGIAAELGNFSTLLDDGKVLVDIDHAVLTDSMFPGFYRALIKEVRLVAKFDDVPTGLTTYAIPVAVTHLGKSSTRVNRGSNPWAPPVMTSVPESLRQSPEQFSDKVVAGLDAVYERAKTETLSLLRNVNLWGGLLPVSLEPAITFFLRELRRSISEGLVAAIRREGSGRVATDPICAPLAQLESTELYAELMTQGLNSVGPYGSKERIQAFISFAIDQQEIVDRLRPRIGEAAKEAFTAAVADARAAVKATFVKWGDVELVEDPDAQVRALGFATLVRTDPPESAVFNLYQEDIGSPELTAVAPILGANQTASPGDVLKQRPFENRGLGGNLLVTIEPGPLTKKIIDLTFEITCRGCYDENLAATVRASRSQRTSQEALARSIPGVTSTKKLLFPGETKDEATGATGLQTVHFSLRAHRDNVLQVALAAAGYKANVVDPSKLKPPQILDKVNVDPTARPLERTDAYSPFGLTDAGTKAATAVAAAAKAAGDAARATEDPAKAKAEAATAKAAADAAQASAGLTKVSLRFQPPELSASTLETLLNTIVVVPENLGIPRNLWAIGGSLEAVGIAIIPMDVSVMGTQLELANVSSGPFAGLMPAFDKAGGAFNPTTRLVMTTTTTQSTPLSTIWTGGDLQLEFTEGLLYGNLYDVIFSLSFRMPSQATKTTAGAVL